MACISYPLAFKPIPVQGPEGKAIAAGVLGGQYLV